MTRSLGIGSGRIGAAFAIGAILALLSACGGSATPAPATGGGGQSQPASQPATAPATPAASTSGGPGDITIPGDPCSLLSVADVKVETGIDFPAGTKASAGSQVECDYALGAASVYLVFAPLDKAAFATGRSVGTPMVGLGDDAYQRATPSELHVALANVEVTVGMSLGLTAARDQSGELAMMKMVIAKLAT